MNVFPKTNGTASSVVSGVRSLVMATFIGSTSYVYNGQYLAINKVNTKTISVDDDNVRLDRYIRRIFPNLKQSIIEKFLRKGLIKVDDCKAKSSDRISSGQIITIKHLNSDQICNDKPKPNAKLVGLLKENILYEDEYILAINKPAGVTVQALTSGIPSKNNGIINHPLVKKYIAGQEKVVVDENSSQNATTHFSILAKLKHNVAYLKLQPITGRTHQLRAHLSHINCSILGDDAAIGPKHGKSKMSTQGEEAIIVTFRKHILLPLDNCLYSLRAIIPCLTRSSLHHCLQRHGISILSDVEGEIKAKKKFKLCPIGYFHIDIAEHKENRILLPRSFCTISEIRQWQEQAQAQAMNQQQPILFNESEWQDQNTSQQ
ncbi:Pseudouridine synthase, catalytic domain,RNA-binding S4 domain,Pseudouridine synthase [Cinara cedri]|uniref:Pseudouridine synthase, catalytic domain,RNA-binding S4 domain,Pseudouridine synthase n=1 Tax=Cinara cedri TaxID=506608 RepID=A0A5E4MMH0_9HEMI|nr:Pseudouridine synthase, catalytic domain,RNA-binding S4 domain,Pseudouridine synthase [Cinara cedri]